LMWWMTTGTLWTDKYILLMKTS